MTGELRRLAAALLFDRDSVEDVVQQTWLTALGVEPARIRSPLSWLKGVVRHQSYRRLRDEGTRRRHEQAVVPADPLEATDDSVARLEVLERVLEAVRALREPYRDVILLRYFEDLSTHAIAKRRGVPEPTIRTQLRRGLEQLRRSLDDRFHDSRPLLLGVLAPAAGVPQGAAALATAAGSSAMAHWTGVLLMTGKLWITIGATLLVGFVLGVAYEDSARGPDSPPSREAAASGPASDRNVPVSDDAPAIEAETKELPTDEVREEQGAAPAGLPPAVVEAVSSWVTGTVVDSHGNPAPGTTVTARPSTPERPLSVSFRELSKRVQVSFRRASVQEDGSFALVGLHPGTQYDLLVGAGEFSVFPLVDREVHPATRITTPAKDVVLRVPGAFLEVEVVVPDDLMSLVDEKGRFPGSLHFFCGQHSPNFGGSFLCSFRIHVPAGEPGSIVVMGGAIRTQVVRNIVVTAAEGVRHIRIPISARYGSNELLLEVVDSAGRPVTEAQAQVGRDFTGLGGPRDPVTIMEAGAPVLDGTCRISNVDPGPATIHVFPRSDSKLVRGTLGMMIPEQGEARGRVVLEIGGELIVKVGSGSRKLYVTSLHSMRRNPGDRSRPWFTEVGKGGIVRDDEVLSLRPGGTYKPLTRLAPGSHEIRYWVEHQEYSQIFEIRSDERTELHLSVP